MNDMTQIAEKLEIAKKQEAAPISDALGYFALFMIALAWLGPFVVHMVGYHLYQFITVVLRIPLGTKTSDMLLMGVIISMVALLTCSVLYWLLQRQGY